MNGQTLTHKPGIGFCDCPVCTYYNYRQELCEKPADETPCPHVVVKDDDGEIG